MSYLQQVLECFYLKQCGDTSIISFVGRYNSVPKSETLNVFNFFSISVGSSRQTHDLCIFGRSQTFNYTLLKYGSLLNRSLCFCFSKRRASNWTVPFSSFHKFLVSYIFLFNIIASLSNSLLVYLYLHVLDVWRHGKILVPVRNHQWVIIIN